MFSLAVASGPGTGSSFAASAIPVYERGAWAGRIIAESCGRLVVDCQGIVARRRNVGPVRGNRGTDTFPSRQGASLSADPSRSLPQVRPDGDHLPWNPPGRQRGHEERGIVG
jgi:hypothetical protein